MSLKYEIKKLIMNKSAIVSFIFLAIWLIGSIVFVINSTTWADEKSTQLINGFDAIKSARQSKSQWNDLLTEDIIAKVINLNSSINNNKEYQNIDGGLSNSGYVQTQPYSDIRSIINNSYCDFSTYDYYMIDSLVADDSSVFYSNRINSIKSWLEDNQEASRLSEREKEFIIESAMSLKTPFYYSYMDGWNNVLNYITMILMVVILVVCIILAPIFSGEYQTGSDSIILSSKYGRSKVIKAKILSAYIITTVIYLICTILFCGIILFIYGIDGYNCPIQINDYNWKSFYHLTNIEAMAVILVIGYVGCLLMTSITIFISSILKTSFAAIIVSFLAIILPQMINTSNFPVYIQKIFTLLPHQTTLGLVQLSYYDLFIIGNNVVTPIQLKPFLYLIVAGILLPFTIKGFKNHQVIN